MPRNKNREEADMPEMSDFEKLKAEFRVDAHNAQNRVNELNAIIPQLEKEKEQLIGMITVMRKTLQHGEPDEEEGKPHEPEDDGDAPDSDEKPGNGSD